MREADELDRVGAAHAAWAVRLCEAAEVALGGPQEAGWAQAVYAHFDDLRAGFDWLIAHNDGSALQLVSSLHFFALWRSESEVFRWAEAAVTALDGRALSEAELADWALRAVPATLAAHGDEPQRTP